MARRPGAASSPAARRAAPPVSYYLALGDSLSQGVQPDASGASVRTQEGYANQLYSALRVHQPGLRLVKLGCPGETTATMISGGICRYPGGSQLAAAVRFLGAHTRPRIADHHRYRRQRPLPVLHPAVDHQRGIVHRQGHPGGHDQSDQDS